MMLVATTIHDRPAVDLLMPDQRERFFELNPRLGGAPSTLPQSTTSEGGASSGG